MGDKFKFEKFLDANPDLVQAGDKITALMDESELVDFLTIEAGFREKNIVEGQWLERNWHGNWDKWTSYSPGVRLLIYHAIAAQYYGVDIYDSKDLTRNSWSEVNPDKIYLPSVLPEDLRAFGGASKGGHSYFIPLWAGYLDEVYQRTLSRVESGPTSGVETAVDVIGPAEPSSSFGLVLAIAAVILLKKKKS